MKDTEINLILQAAHSLGLDSPIIRHRIVGNRVELWTVHGGPYVYEQPADPAPPKKAGGSRKTGTSRSNRDTTKRPVKK